MPFFHRGPTRADGAGGWWNWGLPEAKHMPFFHRDPTRADGGWGVVDMASCF